ncbi:hypothetical protein DBV15_04854 [Temnothorax longispinosus]|uniref:Uncharacterized protein n=1 Tax=Temnothorax longispinosus TaxID=300112 RepID=A0A4S2KHD7_9HYME|nr:hypothetical protein DBV15_04854 [Temnothorax longispinosus]
MSRSALGNPRAISEAHLPLLAFVARGSAESLAKRAILCGLVRFSMADERVFTKAFYSWDGSLVQLVAKGRTNGGRPIRIAFFGTISKVGDQMNKDPESLESIFHDGEIHSGPRGDRARDSRVIRSSHEQLPFHKLSRSDIFAVQNPINGGIAAQMTAMTRAAKMGADGRERERKLFVEARNKSIAKSIVEAVRQCDVNTCGSLTIDRNIRDIIKFDSTIIIQEHCAKKDNNRNH